MDAAEPQQSTESAEAVMAEEAKTRTGWLHRLARAGVGRWLRLSTDAILLVAAFVGAYWLRYEVGIPREVKEEYYLDLRSYLLLMVVLVLLVLAVNTVLGLYHDRRFSLVDEAALTLSGTSIGMILFLAGVFIYRGYAYSRGVFLLTWGLAVLLLIAARVVRHGVLLPLLRHRGIGVRRALVVGDGQLGVMVMHVLATEAGLGYQLVGFVGDNGREAIGRFQSLGNLEALADVAREHAIDEVFVALPPEHHQRVPEITERCERARLSFKLVPDLFEMRLSRVDIDDLRGVPVIGLKEVRIRGFNLWLKRAMDLVVAATALVVLSPVWLVAALAVKVTSPGPVLFRQTRVGRGGRLFTCYKFRSMAEGAEEQLGELSERNEAAGPLFKIRDDPRLTPVGRILRRSSLDELPQLVNVIKGEMSLVGPRPALPREVAAYEGWHMKRLEASPGITGLWQVSGRSELPFDEMVLLDIYYVENWSLGLDLRTMLRTIPAVLSGQGAY